jgi:hypothetical protein
LLRLDEAAERLRYVDKDGTPNVRACREFLRRQSAVLVKRGRAVLIEESELEKTLTRRRA